MRLAFMIEKRIRNEKEILGVGIEPTTLGWLKEYINADI